MASDGEKTAGCILTIWSLFVTAPSWLILLFAVMNANDMPVWAWVLYWVYVPSNILGIITAAIGRIISE